MRHSKNLAQVGLVGNQNCVVCPDVLVHCISVYAYVLRLPSVYRSPVPPAFVNDRELWPSPGRAATPTGPTFTPVRTVELLCCRCCIASGMHVVGRVIELKGELITWSVGEKEKGKESGKGERRIPNTIVLYAVPKRNGTGGPLSLAEAW